jgi:hypothetical protein
MKNKNYTIVGTVPKSNRKIIETKGDGGYIPKDANAWRSTFMAWYRHSIKCGRVTLA